MLFHFLLLYLSFVAVLYFTQRSMIYFPDTQKPDIGAYAQNNVTQMSVRTLDGLTLSGWFKPPLFQKDVVVFFHGNASHYGTRIEKAMAQAYKGYGFLLEGYRGYGGNPGKPSEEGLYNDARAWMHALVNRGVRAENIILYGESLGTGVAVQMALEYPDVKALVLESPYTSLPDVAAKTYFFVPVRLLMKDKFDSLSKIKKVKAPLLVLQGMKDRVVAPSFGQRLFAAANDPKEMVSLEGYGHNDMPDGILAQKLAAFVRSKAD